VFLFPEVLFLSLQKMGRLAHWEIIPLLRLALCGNSSNISFLEVILLAKDQRSDILDYSKRKIFALSGKNRKK